MFSSQQQSPSPRHHSRFYVVVITIIIGGIVFLLMMNNNPENRFSITSAVVNAKNSSLFNNLNEQAVAEDNLEDAEETISADANGMNDVFFTLSSNAIPSIRRGVTLESMELKFSGSVPTIKINNDKLELSNLEQVTLNLKEFLGTLDFDGTYFSLDGTSRRLEINGIALSSYQDIKISFSNLNYNSAILKNAKFDDLQFASGDGTLEVSGKLDYFIEKDQSLLIDHYEGNMDISKESDSATLFTLEGSARGIDSIGTLSFNLR